MLRRLVQLYVGLGLYGLSTAMFIRSDLGVDPWDVFHLGVAIQLGMSIGTVIILIGAAVLLLWVPLRQWPGLGTISNVICIGLAADATMALIPELTSLPLRIALLVAGIVVNAIATGMYIGAGFGPGPRDGLMTGIHARLGWSIRSVRTSIEVAVLLIGIMLGGSFGVGTVLYALTIGPLIQICLPWFRQKPQVQKIPQPEQVV
ncbi:membrane protein YczE [Enterobacter sp. C4G1]|uniref:membrane protein YczE n=1 Tax=Enterobacter sp. C4G1 TaxID=3458724 RepID=UPI004068005B